MKRFKVVLVVVAAVAAGWGAFGALRVGPAPAVELVADRPAVGPATRVTARFEEPDIGLVAVRLEAVQGDRTVVLDERRFDQPSPFRPLGRSSETAAVLSGTLGRSAQGWLEEGEITVRAVAERFAGALRGPEPVVRVTTLPVVLRPPSLQVLSSQHYVRQGGSGAVRFQVGERATLAGVRAGDAEALASPVPDGAPGERFVLFGIPFDMDDPAELRLFAEDAAGNRAEIPFADGFARHPPTRDTIRLPDSFLERVVPAIASQTPGFDASGTLIEQYLLINGPMRESDRGRVRELAGQSVDRRLWSGALLQLPNSQRMAGYADTRTYLYDGEAVDTQTHLGLDLASVRTAPVPAAERGIVLDTGFMGIYGNTVILDHGYGLLTLYAHLSSIGVAAGDAVARGERIGRTGATGLAGGDHLHFGVLVHGVPVDPVEWLDPGWIRDRIEPRMPPPAP